jgi:hypothetical protein
VRLGSSSSFDATSLNLARVRKLTRRCRPVPARDLRQAVLRGHARSIGERMKADVTAFRATLSIVTRNSVAIEHVAWQS